MMQFGNLCKMTTQTIQKIEDVVVWRVHEETILVTWDTTLDAPWRAAFAATHTVAMVAIKDFLT
jgi:hypothetical protein